MVRHMSRDRLRMTVATVALVMVICAGSVAGGYLFQATVGSQAAKAQQAEPIMKEGPPSFAALASAVKESVVAIGTKQPRRMAMMNGPQGPGFGFQMPKDMQERFGQFFGPDGGLGQFFGPDGGGGRFSLRQEGDDIILETPKGKFHGYKDEKGQWWLETPNGEKKEWKGPQGGLNLGPDMLGQGAKPDPGKDGAPKPEGEQPPATGPTIDFPLPVGTGVVISPDGYVVTNNHVVSAVPEDDMWVVLDGDKAVKAKLIGRDEETDVAVLKIDVDYQLQFSRFGDSDAVQVGDWLMAVGHPFGLDHTFTAGILSARGRHLDKTYDEYLQTDAAIHPGNSGGPLYNMNGEIIGVNTAIATNNPISPMGQGIGFAVPSKIVERVANDLMKNGQVVRGYIGVSLMGGPDEEQKRNYDHGALIRELRADGPAAQAGLQVGDVVITFDGQKVDNADALVKFSAAAKPGATVKIEYVREGKVQAADLKVAKRPSLDEIMKLEQGE